MVRLPFYTYVVIGLDAAGFRDGNPMKHFTQALTVATLIAVYPVLAQQPQPPAQNAGALGPSGQIQQRVRPPARIMSFTAEPVNLKPGESALLTWATENPNGVTIDQGVGRVTPRGTIKVTPTATTTYTLTLNGADGTLTRAITVNVAGTVAVAANTPAAPAKKEVPRINGKPDLSGVYGAGGGGGGGRGGRGGGAPAAAADPGALPTTPTLKAGAEKFKIVRPPDDTGQYSDCMPVAGPGAFSVPYQFQLVLSAHSLAILHEYPGTFRTIPIDGVHPQDPDPTWMGDSVAHWEGDTLVVDTVGFNDKTEINGYKHTEALHIVERFSRPDFDNLQYQAVIEDPNVFARPFAVNRTFGLRPDLAKVDEFVCENNRDYTVFFNKK
jgi:hypothetical protein